MNKIELFIIFITTIKTKWILMENPIVKIQYGTKERK